MTGKKICRIILLLIATVIVSTIGYWMYGTRVANGPYAKIELDGYTKPMVIAVNVSDSEGQAASGVSVEYENYSGTSGPEVTNAAGIVTFESGEREVIALYIGEKKVWETPFFGTLVEALLQPPLCVDGLAFKVTLKAEQAETLKP